MLNALENSIILFPITSCGQGLRANLIYSQYLSRINGNEECAYY